MITTPSARAKDATRHLIGRAATPPRRGGEKSQPAQFSYVNITVIKNSRTKLGGNCRAILDTSGHRPRLQWTERTRAYRLKLRTSPLGSINTLSGLFVT